MALRVDRPVGGSSDDLVVFVARTLQEARAARDGLAAEGIACGLSDAALEAVFAEGGGPVPVRVAPENLSRALDVVDRLFPPPEVELPPLPGPVADAPPATEEEEAQAFDRAAARAKGPRLERTALKTLGIACLSLLLPMAGAPFALLAVVGAIWILRRGEGPARTRAAIALAVGLTSLALNAFLIARFVADRS